MTIFMFKINEWIAFTTSHYTTYLIPLGHLLGVILSLSLMGERQLSSQVSLTGVPFFTQDTCVQPFSTVRMAVSVVKRTRKGPSQ